MRKDLSLLLKSNVKSPTTLIELTKAQLEQCKNSIHLFGLQKVYQKIRVIRKRSICSFFKMQKKFFMNQNLSMIYLKELTI